MRCTIREVGNELEAVTTFGGNTCTIRVKCDGDCADRVCIGEMPPANVEREVMRQLRAALTLEPIPE
jgi:hypothetical protein